MQIDGLTKSYGDRLLFGDITFGINQGDKIGLVAKNGTGKTTLLRIIAGKEAADSGDVVTQSGLRVSILEQTPEFDPGETPMTAYDNRAHEMVDLSHEDAANECRATYVRLLSQLGINPDTTMTLDCMSGGNVKRVALAMTLAVNPDMIVLDEPTNHLDTDAIEWLENYLSRQRCTLLMVTHDRYFLDRVCNKIIEIDRTNLYAYDGNYDYYLRRRRERIEAMSADIAKAKNTLRREQEWMSRQPQARAGKAKYRIDNFYRLKDRSSIDLSEDSVRLSEANKTYIGNKIFSARHVSKRYGDKVILDDFSYDFARHDRVGIVGPNGVGKSTFIKMLQGIVAPDTGTWDVGATVRFGYYSQEGITMKPDMKVIDAVTAIADDIVLDTGRVSPMQYLNMFLFSPKDLQKPVGTLSGGELRRLNLAVVLMTRPNFLILDEPTNDLDIVTLGILEEYLADFGGCTIIVSHDRYFLDNTVDHIFVLEGDGKVKDYPGTYSEYRAARRKAESAQPKSPSLSTKAKSRAERPVRMTYAERKEFEALQTEIDALSMERQHLEAIFAGQATDPRDIRELSDRYETVKGLLDDKELRWLELSEKA